jgi:hypothetical protein|tara:strand:+ start:882 stop:1271 length:390 start_codon:yes stop_codon:yes gene_type:complete
MNSYKNNYKRNRFRSNGDRNFRKRNGEPKKFNPEYSSSINFQRKSPGRNNHNAYRLVEKYNDLAREAMSKGDKILSENYFQHADHFARILSEKENHKSQKAKENNETISEHDKPPSEQEDIQEKQIPKS